MFYKVLQEEWIIREHLCLFRKSNLINIEKPFPFSLNLLKKAIRRKKIFGQIQKIKIRYFCRKSFKNEAMDRGIEDPAPLVNTTG